MPERISIITVNYNNSQGLLITLESVARQTTRPWQYLVIDGGSQDDSLKHVERYNAVINDWISEPDRGIYHAMNKGIKMATGDYLLFLNSGDYLADPTALEKMIPYLSADLVYGDIFFVKEKKLQRVCFPEHLPFSFFVEGVNSLPHPGTFIKKELFCRVGMYNENYKIVSDWSFFLLALHKHNCTYQHVQIPISVYNLDGVSSLSENANLVKQERQEILKYYFPTFVDDYLRLQQFDTYIKKWRSHWLGKIYSRL